MTGFSLAGWASAFLDFVAEGGIVIWLILAFTLLMWGLLLEGWSKLKTARRAWVDEAAQLDWMWKKTSARERTAIRRAWLAVVKRVVASEVAWTKVIVAILPVFGLLGTVDGMIESFDALADTRSREGLTAGISTALLTTLAGLVTALSGVFSVYRLERSAHRLERDVRAALRQKSQKTTSRQETTRSGADAATLTSYQDKGDEP